MLDARRRVLLDAVGRARPRVAAKQLRDPAAARLGTLLSPQATPPPTPSAPRRARGRALERALRLRALRRATLGSAAARATPATAARATPPSVAAAARGRRRRDGRGGGGRPVVGDGDARGERNGWAGRDGYGARQWMCEAATPPRAIACAAAPRPSALPSARPRLTALSAAAAAPHARESSPAVEQPARLRCRRGGAPLRLLNGGGEAVALGANALQLRRRLLAVGLRRLECVAFRPQPMHLRPQSRLRLLRLLRRRRHVLQLASLILQPTLDVDRRPPRLHQVGSHRLSHRHRRRRAPPRRDREATAVRISPQHDAPQRTRAHCRPLRHHHTGRRCRRREGRGPPPAPEACSRRAREARGGFSRSVSRNARCSTRTSAASRALLSASEARQPRARRRAR